MKFCSNCSNPVTLLMPEDDNHLRYVCRTCGMIHYQNPKVVVGCIPEWQNAVLLCRRDIEPQKGLWTLPAGYLENGETVAAGAGRETLEETGATVIDLTPYLLFDIPHINQIYLMFRARLAKPDYHVTPESSELRLFEEHEIPWDALAFRVIEQTLRCFYKDRANGYYPFQIKQVETAAEVMRTQ